MKYDVYHAEAGNINKADSNCRQQSQCVAVGAVHESLAMMVPQWIVQHKRNVRGTPVFACGLAGNARSAKSARKV